MKVAAAKLELTLALFVAHRPALGQAAELAALPLAEFQMHLGTRHLGSPYDASDARDDRETRAA